MMTAVGRGRGNWGSKDFSTPLRRPGESSRPGSGEDDNLIKEIENLDIKDDRKVISLEEQIQKYCDNREHLWKICQKMYESGTKDRKMIDKVIKLWKNLSDFEVNEVKLKSVVLKMAQKDYEERQEVHDEDPERFLNTVGLFGGIYHNLTPRGGGIFSVLVGPMMDYMEFLLAECSKDASLREAELEMIATQMYLNNSALKEHAKCPMEEFGLHVRSALASSPPSSKCYYWLLLILDLTTHDCSCQQLPAHLSKFYLEKLGNAFQQFMRDVPRLSSGDQSRNIVKKETSGGTLAHTIKAENKVSNYYSTEPKDNNYTKPNRRTGQDGSFDHQERKKPPYWAHDDRFDDHSGSNKSTSHSYSKREGQKNQGGQRNWRDRGDSGYQGNNRDTYGSGRREPSRSNQPNEARSPPEESWD